MDVDEKKDLDEIKEREAEALKGWRTFFDISEKAHRFYAGDSWTPEAEKKARDNKIDLYVNNICDKAVNTLAGHSMQNQFDPKMAPIEGGDQLVSEVMSKAVKYVENLADTPTEQFQSFKQALIGGLGWLKIRHELEFTGDPVDGEVLVDSESCFNILADPFFTKQDLSDAAYLFHTKYADKGRVKALFPNKASEIDDAAGENYKPMAYGTLNDVPYSRDNLLKVTDYYFRENVKKTQMVNLDDASVFDWDDRADEFKAFETPEDFINVHPVYKKIAYNDSVVKYHTIIADTVFVQKNVPCYSKQYFPFVPFFGFYLKHYNNEWDKKLQGIVTGLFSYQQETNIRRTQLIYAHGARMKAGWLSPKGAVDDIDSIFNSGGYDRIIEYNANVGKPEQMPPQILDPGAIKLEEMSRTDAVQRVNADLMGQIDGGSAASAPGITLQIRTRQAMKSFQEMFEHFTFANKLMAKHIAEIVKTFSHSKIKRILGDDFPFTAKNKQFKEAISQLKIQTKKAIDTIDDQEKELDEQIDKIQNYAGQFQQMDPSALNEENVIGLEQEAQGVVNQAQQLQAQVMQLEQQKKMLKKQLDLQLREILDAMEKNKEDEAAFWVSYEDSKNLKYDCKIIEVPSSPTSRISAREELLQIAQYGQDPALQEMFIDLMDIDQNVKDNFLARKQSQMRQNAPQ